MKQLFEELRAQEQRTTPQFDVVLARRHARQRPLWLLAAAAVIAALLVWPRHMKDDVASTNIMQWRAPTDALLPDGYKSVLNFEDLP